jgi:uncharacterized membrane protein
VKVSSPSGDFEVLIKRASIERDFIVLKAQIGVWDSKIYFSIGELWSVATILFLPFIVLLLKLTLRFLFGWKRG